MPNLKSILKNIFSTDKQTRNRIKNETPPMPPKEELNRQFEEFLKTISMPEKTVENLKDISDENKWIMICQYKLKEKQESPDQWIKKISNGCDAETMTSLKAVFTSVDVNWLQKFFDKKGLEYLVKNLKNQTNDELEVACLLAIKAFMNSDFGLKSTVRSVAIFEYFSYPLRSKNPETLQTVFDILMVIVWVSVEGFDIVYQALNVNMEEMKLKTIFSPMINLIRSDKHEIDIKISAITFINTMINSIHNLEERNHNRRFLLDENILEISAKERENVKTIEDDKKAYLYMNQFDIFERELENDRKDTELRNINFDDPDVVWNYVLKTSIESGQSAYLLDMLRYFLVIPNVRRLGYAIWNNCQYALILSMTFIINDKEIDEIEKNLESMNKNVSIDEIIQNSFTKGARLLKYSEIDRLMKKVTNISATTDLNESRYEDLRKEFHEYKMKKEAEIDLLKKQGLALGSQAPQPQQETLPPPVADSADLLPPPGGDLLAPPGGDLLPPPGDLLAPPGGDLLPPPGGDLLPPPGGDLLAPPGGLLAPPGGGLMAPTMAKPYLPAKPNPAPKVKMKNVHWGALPVNKIEGTVWDHIKDDNVVIDSNELESMFQAKAAPVKTAQSDKPKKVIKEKVQLIDSKRSTNVEIALSRIKMTPEEIRDSILEMNEKKLNVETIQKLLNLVPTNEEAETCSSYEGDLKELGVTELFFRTLSSVKNVTGRLQIFLFKLQFESIYNEIMEDIKKVQSSLDIIDKSKRFKEILAIILKTGNYMNGGTKKGGVYGYKLSSLKQLESTKSVDNKVTLLQYIAKFIQNKNPDLVGFVDEFSVLELAVRIECQSLQGKVNKMKADINRTNNMIKGSKDDNAKDRFKTVMESFYNEAADKAAKMHVTMTNLIKQSEELITKFAEDPSKMKWEELFGLISSFVESFKAALKYWEIQEENKKREAKKMNFAKEIKNRLNRKSEDKIDDKGAENVLKNLKETQPDTLTQELLKRRKAAM